MPATSLWSLLVVGLLVFLACYFQSLIGFGLSMLVMGGNAAFHALPVATAATLVSLLTLGNTAIAMHGLWRQLPTRQLLAATLGLLPALALGMVLLNAMQTTAALWLQALLGLAIAHGGWSSRPQPHLHGTERAASSLGFGAAGAISGLMGGMFSVPGPPLIVLSLRQPWPLARMRAFLLVCFGLLYVLRAAMDVAQGAMTREVLWLGAASLPLLAAGSWLGRRHAPRVNPGRVALVVAACLILLGLYLAGDAAWRLVSAAAAPGA